MIKKLVGAVLATSIVLSSAMGGGVDVFADSSASFAEDELTSGVYTVPVIRRWSSTNDGKQTSSPLHFYAQGILTVNGQDDIELTIGVENWSLYDAFIPREQGYFNEEYRYLPSSLFDSENTNKFTNFSYSDYEDVIDSDNSKYKIASAETKYGNISVDYETHKDIDVAFVTFDLDDYKEAFSFSAWLNTPFYGYNPTSENATSIYYPQSEYSWADVSFKLDYYNSKNVDALVDSTADDLTYNLGLASNRSISTSKNNMANRCHMAYDGNAMAKGVFDSSTIVKKSDGTYLAKYHVNPNGYVYRKKTNYYSAFKSLDSVTHPIINSDSTSIDDWDLNMTGSYSPLEVDADGNITVVYETLNDALMGKYIFFDCGDTTDNTIFYCLVNVSTAPIEEVTIVDEESGIYIVTDTSKYSKNTKLKVEKNADVLRQANNGEYVQASIQWNSSLYKNPVWYTFTLTDENGNVLDRASSEFVDVYVPVSGDSQHIEILGKDGKIKGSNARKTDIANGYYQASRQYVDNLTVAIMEMNETSNVYEISEDGIYTANAYFTHHSYDGCLSMADSGLEKKVYIVVNNGIKKMLFKSHDVLSGCYIGEVQCNNVETSGAVFEDSISYTAFEIVDGEIVNNTEYDGYTEFANVEGGILTLMDESYLSDSNAYSIALVAPVMQCLSGTPTPFDKIKKDETVARLVFTSLEKCDDKVTLDKVLNEYGYGYQSSALLRKIRQTEIKYNIGKNTASDSTAFTEAYKVYKDPDAKSQDIEAAIKALDAVTTDVAPSAVIKGHDLTVNQWYELSYYVDLGYDVQSDKNAKVVFTLADGRTKTFDITDDLFVAGQGYRFTLELAAKQMADKIHAKVVFSDGTEKDFSDEYSVKEFLNDYISTGEDENLKAFAQATLNYGAYAQKFFDYNTEDLAAELADFSDVSAEQITDPASSIPKNVGDEIEFAGAALTLEGETSIKLYFELTGEFRDPDDHTIKYNGKKLEMQASNVSDVWYVTMPGIKAKQLGNVFKFTVDGTEYEYSPYTYMNKVLTNWEDTKYPYLHDLLKALYAYSTAANKC